GSVALRRQRRDAFQLYRDGGGQGVDAQGGAAGRGVDVGEVPGPDGVVGLEVAGHVGQVHGHVHQVLPARSAGLEHGAHVGEHGVGLGGDVVGNEVPFGVVHVARDGVAGGVARADAG